MWTALERILFIICTSSAVEWDMSSCIVNQHEFSLKLKISSSRVGIMYVEYRDVFLNRVDHANLLEQHALWNFMADLVKCSKLKWFWG